MATLTIRKLDDTVKAKLRIRAAEHGRSMEEEVREILEVALSKQGPPGPPRGNMAERIRRRFEPLGGVVLNIPERTISRPPVDFSGPEFGEYDEEQ
jgi:plasmid stability protein